MIKKKHIPLLVTLVLLAFMAITNPGAESFNSFAKKQLIKHNFNEQYVTDSLITIRMANYIILSKYQFRINDSGVPMEGNYVGIFGCFIEVGDFTINEK